jgi:para-aminobenzoate synthetase
VLTLIIDNKDSFTFNIFQMVAEVNGVEPIVITNEVPWRELAKINADNIIISPGPGHPANAKDFGACRDAILFSQKPLLGVCLGHQGLAIAYGGTVAKAPTPMHGRISAIEQSGDRIFAGIPSKFNVVRYHSLLALKPLPDCLQEIARTDDGLTMAIRHKHKPQWGVQFHPESICSEYGLKIFQNFKGVSEQRLAA